MPSVEKELMMKEIVQEFEKSPYAFISSFHGLKVSDLSEIRRNLEKVSSRSIVVKHTMACKILKQLNFKDTDSFLNGSVVLTFGDKDPQKISKALMTSAKGNEKWKPSGVIFEGDTKGFDFVKRLAALPSKKELLTQMLLRMNAPISGFVTVLSGLTRGLVVALSEIKKQKEASA